MAYHFQAGEGALWAQIEGPNTKPVYLGCHQIGDIDEPQGDVELIYCPDPSAPNRFEVVGSTVGAAGAVTTTVTTDVTDELDWLERVRCPFTLFIHMVESGRKDVFTNYSRSFILRNARITTRGLSNLAARTPDDNGRSEQTFDLSGEDILRIVDLTISRQSISETANIVDITFCNEQRCRTDEVQALDSCQTGFAATDAPSGSPAATAEVLVTTNGATWTAAGAAPFAAGSPISAIACFELGRDEVRVVAARGDEDGGPLDIAYSDDSGATWTEVTVGSDNDEMVPTRHSMFIMDRNNAWIGSDDGRIFYSEDACLTWTVQEDQVIHTGEWNCIEFVDENVGWAAGASNIVAKTTDGGTSWSAVTGPNAGQDAISIEVFDRNRVWLGYGDGTLWYTLDAGVTWTQRTFTGSGSGELRDVYFLNDQYGYILHNTASPVGSVKYTIDGGYSWLTMTTPTNLGLNALWVCDLWSFFVVGNTQGGLGYIAKGAL